MKTRLKSEHELVSSLKAEVSELKLIETQRADTIQILENLVKDL